MGWSGEKWGIGRETCFQWWRQEMRGPVPEEKQRERSGGEARDIEKADLTAFGR